MKEILKKIFYAAAVIMVVFVGWTLRARAVRDLPVDYDEDDYLRAAQLMAVEIQDKDLAGLMETNYRPEHPPLAKLVYGAALAPLPEAPLVPDAPTTASPNSNLPEPHFTQARKTASLLGTLEVLLLAIINPLAGLMPRPNRRPSIKTRPAISDNLNTLPCAGGEACLSPRLMISSSIRIPSLKKLNRSSPPVFQS